MSDNYCNNCGKQGHLFHQCKLPITSNGIIAFRNNNNTIEYLMICRKDSLGYIDLLRGKYNVLDKPYLLEMIQQMTLAEKTKILMNDFNTLWYELWGHSTTSKYKNEEGIAFEKYNKLKKGYLLNSEVISFKTLIEESTQKWVSPEWGFPKGRRNYQEKDYQCAVREFCEETGYSRNILHNVENIMPLEEIFTGSNYKSYKHKYFVSYIKYEDSLKTHKIQDTEVSELKWLSYDNALITIREYNLEKKNTLTNLNTILTSYRMFLL
jgi:8-oxo-dGTP pyrophosphatase MutT (NUDIX family)